MEPALRVITIAYKDNAELNTRCMVDKIINAIAKSYI